MKDPIGDRMKSYYEDRTRYYLPRRTYTVIRIDGKGFSKYTNGLNKPFDVDLIQDMDETTKFLCENIQGVKIGYTQSDEITLILTDFDEVETAAWFDGNIQKIVSISASLATAKFNQLRMKRSLLSASQGAAYSGDPDHEVDCEDVIERFKLAMFDARVYTIPHIQEVVNNLIWRQKDAIRNSISAVAQSLYSSNQLKGANTHQMVEMISDKGRSWFEYPEGQKLGRMVVKKEELILSTKSNYDKSNYEDRSKFSFIPFSPSGEYGEYYIKRNKWNILDAIDFIKEKEIIKNVINNGVYSVNI